MKNRKRIIVSVIAIVLALGIGAVCRYMCANDDPIFSVNIQALEHDLHDEIKVANSDTLLRFERQIITLADMEAGDQTETVFRFENVGMIPVLITDITTTCGCTSIQWDKQPLKPGDHATITITFRAETPGTFFKKIRVYHSIAATPVELAIEGSIK